MTCPDTSKRFGGARPTLPAAILGFALPLLLAFPAAAKVDLVTLPDKDRVELTIYNAADLTVVRDQRALTLREGDNRLQFSWANTLVDPTSLELRPTRNADQVTIQDLVYPPRTRGLGIWNLHSELAGATPVEISYFTSGIHWRAYYLATLSADETQMRLEGYVQVDNRSGEDYTNASTRLVVGKIHLLDRIAELARRPWPYGHPGPQAVAQFTAAPPVTRMRRDARAELELAAAAPKEIRKEGLSEYFLYTIEGTEDLPDGWGKRLASFRADQVPVRNLYRYETERYGDAAMRFLSFANDADHNLGLEPIPGGAVQVYQQAAGAGQFQYVGAHTTKYVPMGETVQLQLGPTREVVVKPTLHETRSDNFEWKEQLPTRESHISGWDEHRVLHWEVVNHRQVPVQVEIRRNFPVYSWELKTEGNAGSYEKVDRDTVQFTLDLGAGEKRAFSYHLTLHHGSRGL